MNQRIKELTGQVLDEIVPDTWTTLGYDKIKQIQYRTAELIVRECMNITDEQKKWVEDMEVFNEQDATWNKARIQQSQRIVDKIKQHFGVEE
jgi:hypothetical protein